MFSDCKSLNIPVIHLAVTLNYNSQHQQHEVEAALTEGSLTTWASGQDVSFCSTTDN